jgi:purine-nucleoside phosphorylase
MAGDVTLALSCTPCKYVVFIGSAGSMHESIAIGNLITISESVSGDGFSNYLKNQPLQSDSFLTSVKPDNKLNLILEQYANAQCQDSDVVLNRCKIFSTDTIIAQFFHLPTIINEYSCTAIEMETSAVFNAASLTGIKAAALLLISDVTITNKSLFSGRTEQDREFYHHIRETYLSKIVLDTLTDERLY